jgi:ATP-dependent protease ClpP protease subunit
MSRKKASPSQSDFDEELILGPLLGQDKKPYKVFETEMTIREISYYISEPIVDPIEYAEMIHAIRNAGDADQIRIHLNNTGGNVATGIQIINAIRESAATVTTVLDGEAYSMAAILFLCGDRQQVGDHGQLMFHDYSSGLVGKGNEQRAAVLSAAKWFGKLMQEVCSPFLTDEEIHDILNGRDLWIDSDEVIERLVAIQKLQEEAQKALDKAARDAEKAERAQAKAKPAARKTTRKTAARKPATRRNTSVRKATPVKSKPQSAPATEGEDASA